MNDEDGYTMVDETFGVREASDASDTELDSLPPSTDTLVQHNPPISPPPIQTNERASRGNARLGTGGEREEEAARGSSPVVVDEGVAPASPISNNNAEEASPEPPTPRKIMTSPEAVVCVVPASPAEMIKEAVADMGCSPRLAAAPLPADVTISPVSSRQEESHVSTKAVNVRLLPPGDGGCSFGTVVPGCGEGSLASLDDLEREVQRRLGLRQRLRLGDVQVMCHSIRDKLLGTQSVGCSGEGATVAVAYRLKCQSE